MLAIPISLPAPSELPVAVVAVIAFGPIAIGLGIYFYATRHTRFWKRGIYPPTLKFSQDNLLEAYLSLSARMMGNEKGKRSVQVQFINRYFNRYFPMSNYNFADSLVYSMRYPIQIPSVCGWLTAQLPKDPERAQVLFFLAGIASLNGEISSKERHFLERIRLELQLSEEILTHIYSIYASFNAHFEERKTQRPMGKTHRAALYRNVLGVPANADVTAIKKAYRSLAKQYHPDTLINATDAQKKMAEDKFNEIRNAYEFLMEDRG